MESSVEGGVGGWCARAAAPSQHSPWMEREGEHNHREKSSSCVRGSGCPSPPFLRFFSITLELGISYNHTFLPLWPEHQGNSNLGMSPGKRGGNKEQQPAANNFQAQNIQQEPPCIPPMQPAAELAVVPQVLFTQQQPVPSTNYHRRRAGCMWTAGCDC
eukprot:1160914-Pelagomonas_calceolata.AAC.13